MTAAEQEQLARLAAGFHGVVTHRGIVYISPPWPTLLVVLPDGETEGVRVRWPDERGENNRPHVGQRVRVSSQGEIEILVDAVWTNPPSYVTPPAAATTGKK